MRIILERGNSHEGGVDFVRFVSLWSVDTKVTIPKSVDDRMGNPVRVAITVEPA